MKNVDSEVTPSHHAACVNLYRLFSANPPVTVRDMEPSQQLSREAVDEFKSAYREEFGRDLSDSEVQEMGLQLLRLFNLLLRPNP